MSAVVGAQFELTRQIAFQPNKRSIEEYRFERRIKQRTDSWIKTNRKLQGYIKTEDHMEVNIPTLMYNFNN